MDILNSVLSTLPDICINCSSENSIIRCMSSRGSCFKYGLSEKLLFHCSNCKKYNTSFNSIQTRNSKLSSDYMKLMSGLFLHLISIGCASLNKLCSIMDLPPPVTPSCYNNILKKLNAHASVEQANNIMKESASS